MTWISSTVSGVFILLFVLFAVVNRYPATIDLFPFPFLIDVPLSLIFLGGMILGSLIGSIWTWLSHSRIRREARIMHKLKCELETLKATPSAHSEISHTDHLDNQQSRSPPQSSPPQSHQTNLSQSLLLSTPSGPQYHAITVSSVHNSRPDAAQG